MLTYLNKLTGVYNANKTNITFNGSLQGENDISNIGRLVFVFRGEPFNSLDIGNPTGANPIRISFYNNDESNPTVNFLHNMGYGFKCTGLTLEFEDCSNYHEQITDEEWEHFVISKAMPLYPFNDSTSESSYGFIQTNTKARLSPAMYDENVKVIIPWYKSDTYGEEDITVEMLIFYE